MPITFALVAAVGGAASAVLQASLLTNSMSALVLWYFSQLPLFLVGLSMGTGAGLLAAGVSVGLMAAFGGIIATVSSLAVHAAPAVLVARQALLQRADGQGGIEWYPPGKLLVGAIGVASLLFLGALVWGSSFEGGLEGALLRYLTMAFQSISLPPEWSGPSIAELTLVMSYMFPAGLALMLLWMVIVNGALAQAILRRAGRNLRPTFDFRSMELPRWYHAGTAIAGIGMMFGGTAGFAGFNLFVIFALGYFIQGMAVIHSIMATWTQKYLWLTATYILLFLIMGPATVLVMLLGAIEPWVQLRRRFAALPSPWR